MSTYVLMKILESTPDRYDKGIGILTHGKLDRAYDRLLSGVGKGKKVLDIGCGTGALALKAARQGAAVKGIDINSQMLEIAQRRANEAGLARNIELSDMGVAELGTEPSQAYDVVMSGLCFSELSEDELWYTLKEVKRILKPGGTLLIADEAESGNFPKRMLSRVLRLPLQAIVYFITQTGTSAVRGLPEKVKRAGFLIKAVRLNKMENFIELAAIEEDRTTG